MIFIENNFNDIFFNLALEEYIFEKFKKNDIFMLWINEPSVVIGKHQNLIEEVNMKYCFENNIKIARRLSGGGCVFHDLNNLNYTIISNTKGDTNINFKEFIKPIHTSLKNLNINVYISPRNDLKIEDRKVCGHSEFVRKNRVLHHGCILFCSNLENLKRSLNVNKKNIISNSAKSVRSEVSNLKDICNLDYDILTFKNLLKEEILKIFKNIIFYNLTDEDIENIENLKETKYLKKEWIYGQSPKSTIILDKEKNMKLDIEYGKIKKVYENKILENFIGNYFEINEIFSKIDKENLFFENDILKKLIDNL